MPSIDGPWTREEEDKLLEAYRLKPMPGLDDSWKWENQVAPGIRGIGVYSREEALEKIREIRRTVYRGGSDAPK